MRFFGIDHIVLTVRSIEKSLEFYCAVLGMEEVSFGKGRKAALCGNQKINFHEAGKEFEPKAQRPTSGSADICFLIEGPLDKAIAHLQLKKVPIVEGPVERTGAKGKILSVYIRDPDQNLIELSHPDTQGDRRAGS